MSKSYLYTCYFDLEGSSSSELTIHQQIAKLEQLNTFVREIFHPNITYTEMLVQTPSPSYSSPTGDGAVLCFDDGLPILQFSIFLHEYLAHFNREQKEEFKKIHVRMGISSGETLLVIQFYNAPSAPWGREMVIAKRTMDIASPDQILINKDTMNQIKQFIDSGMGYSFKDMGKHETKHGDISTGEVIGNENKLNCKCEFCKTSTDDIKVSI